MGHILALLLVLVVLSQLVTTSHAIRLRQALLEHLCVITGAGLPVGPGLRALADERVAGRIGRRDRKGADLIRGLASRFEASGSLAGAFEDVPRTLISKDQLALLRTAEAHGALSHALEVLCDEEREHDEGRWQTVQWLSYPAILGALLVPMSMFQTLVIHPKFAAIQDHMGLEEQASWVAGLPWILLTGLTLLALIVVGLRNRTLAPRIARRLGDALDLVFWGAPYRRRRHGRWMTRAAALLHSGATLPEALAGAAELPDVGSAELKQATQRAREGELIGAVLEVALGRDARTLLAPTLLAVERAGSLGSGLEAQGRRLEELAARRLTAVGEALRPLPVVFLALIAMAHAQATWGAITKIEGAVVGGVW